MPDPVLSLILSFRNEEEVLPELIRALKSNLDPLEIPYEMIFINDASTDNSRKIIEEHAAQHPEIKMLNLSRRFGVAASMLAGLHHATGSAAIIMDTDMQDPPELLPEMIAKWKDGAELVYTVRRSRLGEHPFKMWLTGVAYKILYFGSEIKIPVNAGDFKLLSRRVIDTIKSSPDKEPYLRGLAHAAGFRQAMITYDRQARHAGRSHFPLIGRGPAKMFLSGLTSFSTAPFELLSVFGALLLACSSAAFIVQFVLSFVQIIPVWSWFAVFFVFLGGVQCLGLGILGFYLARVLKQVQGHPEYVIESTVGFEFPAVRA